VLGQREHVAAGHFVERLQRRHHHDDERHDVDEREDDEQAIDNEARRSRMAARLANGRRNDEIGGAH
jgi:hypothetical protein